MDFLTRVTLNHEKAKEIFEKLEKAEALLREVYMDVDSSVSVHIEAPVNSEDCDRQGVRALKQVFQEERRFA